MLFRSESCRTGPSQILREGSWVPQNEGTPSTVNPACRASPRRPLDAPPRGLTARLSLTFKTNHSFVLLRR